ncbi:MAG: hypothetical protein E7585_03990 [Ruminococcaceae bacterium]|nr:hypothetical protein [Oscillospiraceae bacterium]
MRRNAARRARYRVSQVICVLLLLALLAAILFWELDHKASGIGWETAKIATYTYTDRFEGYVFREETALQSGGYNGPIEYQVTEGSAVKAGDHLANVYLGDLGGTAQRDQAAEIYEEITRLERALERDVIAWQATYLSSYADMMRYLTAGDWQVALCAGEKVAETLERRSVMSNDQRAVIEDRIVTLYAQADALLRNVTQDVRKLSATQDGFFTTETDGYEASFGTDAIAALTPEALKARLSQPNPTSWNVGKVVDGGTFYLVIPILPEDAIGYAEGDTYRVHMARGGEADMLLERISSSADGKEMILILHAEKMPVGMDYARRQPIVLEKKSVRGLRVPRAALMVEAGQTGLPNDYFVYVIKGGKAVKRPIEEILCEEGGVCIVSLSVAEGFLSVGEQILITSRSVYEGKELI